MRERLTVYFDYICPYSWRAAEVVELIAEPLGLVIDWRHFSLYQHTHQSRHGNGSRWQLWNEPLDDTDGSGCKGLLPFLASQAARKQGEVPYHDFRLGLQRANHRDHRPLNGRTIFEVAEEAHLHLARFEDDLANPECRTVLAHEHHQAAAIDVAGTPTVVFPGGQMANFRLHDVPRNPEEALALFQDTRSLLERYPYLQSVHRPRARGN